MTEHTSDLLGALPDEPMKKKPSNEISNYPHKCGCEGCHEDTVVALLRVADPISGKTRVGNFSMFGYVKHGRGEMEAQKLLLREGYQFRGWVTRCAYHYAIDVARAGKSASKKMKKCDIPPPTNDEERLEFREMIRKLASQIGA